MSVLNGLTLVICDLQSRLLAYTVDLTLNFTHVPFFKMRSGSSMVMHWTANQGVNSPSRVRIFVESWTFPVTLFQCSTLTRSLALVHLGGGQEDSCVSVLYIGHVKEGVLFETS